MVDHVFHDDRAIAADHPITLEVAQPPVAPPGADWACVIAASGLNPKGLLLFLALLPQFVRLDAPWPVAAQTATLGAVHMLNWPDNRGRIRGVHVA